MTPSSIDTFFKYHDAETAKIVLGLTSRRWSSPSLFNDPFDNDFSVTLTDDHDLLAKNHFDRTISFLTRKNPIPGCEINVHLAKYEWMRKNLTRDLDDEFKKSLLAQHKAHVVSEAAKFNVGLEEIRKYSNDTAIFCVSKTHDSILMWSHYSQSHTGVVLEFQCVPDSPLTIARPVVYSLHLPVIECIPIGTDSLAQDYMDKITYTKSSDWAYEKEWRVPTTHRDKRKTIEDLPFNPKELKNVYLGCKITPSDKREIISIVRLKYPDVGIFQGQKHPKLFSLEFKSVA